MSPNNKKKLNQIRKNLDKLDNKLINLIKIRKNLVDEVIKQIEELNIEDIIGAAIH